ncbi:hypothetical protein PYW07_015104 [Mythimna separata]|uniref:FP protein C-terminal domain-containing protein n=1 Tax=Mythimna separata TaxID=271217 RepID=A0AAD7YWQ3_MYTSE|nr:hypothetical protein PYW07_015104 [Mythimna separata]
MPRTPRTPPKGLSATSPKNSKACIHDSHSEPDLTSAAAARKRKYSKDHCPVNQIDEIHDMLETWKAEQDLVLKKLTSDMAALKFQNDQIRVTNQEIEKSMSLINSNYEDMKSKLLRLEEERKEFIDCILGLEQKVKDMQHSSRASSIEIKNIPTPEKESVEDLISIVTNVGTSMNVDIKPDDIRDVYRLPGKAGAPRSIFAEFSTVHMKNDLLLSTRTFNRSRSLDEKLNTETFGLPGKRQPVYIMEYLPPTTRKLFYKAREFAKSNNFLFCWCSNGQVFLRKDKGVKQVRIESELTLNNLKSKQ